MEIHCKPILPMCMVLGCGEEGKGCQVEWVSHLKAASNSVLLGNAHFFFLSFVIDCGNEIHPSK